MDTVIEGKFATVGDAPWYMLQFDRRGQLLSPKTRKKLLEDLESGEYSDLILFSHGWNNDWDDAINLYTGFFEGYFKRIHQLHAADLTRPFKPLYLGVAWPSIILLLPWEKPPTVAGGPLDPDQPFIDSLADEMAPNERKRLLELAGRSEISREEAQELLALVTPLFGDDEDPVSEIAIEEEVSETDLLAQLERMQRETSPAAPIADDFTAGGFMTSTAPAADEPQAAGSLLEIFDPRMIIRAATVWQMKDRAGRVGAHGVSAILADILDASQGAHVRLIGHSYGCKVVLSALCFRPLPRQVRSLLLLQPAVSHLCFADKEQDPRLTRSGGYRPALARVGQPILSTFSSNDGPLHKAFHLAVRRKSDLAEVQIAGEAPSKFAALGGYGPASLRPGEGQTIELKDPGRQYDLDSAGPQIFGLQSTGRITGHGDISNDFTYWALFNQILEG